MPFSLKSMHIVLLNDRTKQWNPATVKMYKKKSGLFKVSFAKMKSQTVDLAFRVFLLDEPKSQELIETIFKNRRATRVNYRSSNIVASDRKRDQKYFLRLKLR